METVELQPLPGEALERRRLTWPAERARRAEPGVVEHDHQTHSAPRPAAAPARSADTPSPGPSRRTWSVQRASARGSAKRSVKHRMKTRLGPLVAVRIPTPTEPTHAKLCDTELGRIT